MSRPLFVISICLICISAFPSAAVSDSNIKNLILTDCEKAKSEFFNLPESEQLPLFDFFKRVLELKSPQAVEDPNTMLPIQAPGGSPFGAKPFGEDYFRSISPTREVDAKICVLKIAIAKKNQAVKLIPGLFELETNLLISDETKFFLRRSLLEIAQANQDKTVEINEVINEILPKLNSKNSWLLSAVLVEFGPNANSSLSALIDNKEEYIFKTGINTLETNGSNQELLASLLTQHENKLSPKRVDQLLELAVRNNLTSIGLLKYILLKLAQPGELNRAEFLKLLSNSSESILELIPKEPTLESSFNSVLASEPINQISNFVDMACVQGRCDKSLIQLIKNSSGISDSEARALTFLSLSESFDADLWKYAEGIWKDVKSPNRSLALVALGSFPGKKEQALGYLGQAIGELSNKKLVNDKRPELLRAVAQTMAKLSPVPAKLISQSLGEEILGLTSDGNQLAALAIASIKPSPIALLIKELDSKSEGVVNETLLAIEKSHPLDLKLFVALLEQTGEVSLLTSGDEEKLSADRVIHSYGDSGIVILEQLSTDRDSTVAKKAALRLLKQRASNRTAKNTLSKNFSKLSCEGKFEVIALSDRESSFKAEQIKHCSSELISSKSLRDKLVDLRQNLAVEEWKAFSEQIPLEIVLSQCTQELFLLPKEEIAIKLTSISEELQSLGSLCASRIAPQLSPQAKEKFLIISEQVFKTAPTLDIKYLAASIRLGSHSDEIEKAVLNLLNQETLSAALGELLKDDKHISEILQNVDNDLLVLPGFDKLVCHSHLTNAQLETKVLNLLPKEKEENILSLTETLSCLNPNSPVLSEQLFKIALTPSFEENKDSKIESNLLKIANETKWPLVYLEKRLKLKAGRDLLK